MAKLRKCLVCGTGYKYCNTCGDYNPDETWRFVFDKQECYDIYNEWQKYHSNVVDGEGLKESLRDFDLTDILSDKVNTMISSDIKDVFLKKEYVKPEKKEEKIESTEESVDKIESIKKAENFMNIDKKNNYYKNKKNNNKTV